MTGNRFYSAFTDLTDTNGMLFWPYPPDGPAREASFWMKNTPSSLDIIFIRPDGTIATIAENAVPQDETQLTSGEPVSAVLGKATMQVSQLLKRGQGRTKRRAGHRRGRQGQLGEIVSVKGGW